MTSAPQSPAPPRGHVLVVDDEPGQCEMLAHELAYEGYAVETAESGEAAVARAQERQFDLAVTDLKMPGMGGIATVAALKQQCPDIEVIVATGYATVESAVACMRSGAYDYIQKPYDLDEIRLTLERALQKARLEGLAALYTASRRLLGLLRIEEIVGAVPDVARQVVRADEVSFTREALSPGPAVALQPDRLVCRVEPHDAPGGVLVLARRPGTPRFSNGDARRAELFAALVAIALEKAELYHRLEQLVATDELTSLFSRRFFLEAMQQQVRISSRTGLPLACLIADIDHFKRVNDTQGHFEGDRVLATVGRQIKEVFRQSDVAARLGGEEFAILLPATSLSDACTAAERLRRAIESGDSGVTVSIGASGFAVTSPVDAAHIVNVAATLLKRADEALYESKAAGRNRITAKPLLERDYSE